MPSGIPNVTSRLSPRRSGEEQLDPGLRRDRRPASRVGPRLRRSRGGTPLRASAALPAARRASRRGRAARPRARPRARAWPRRRRRTPRVAAPAPRRRRGPSAPASAARSRPVGAENSVCSPAAPAMSSLGVPAATIRPWSMIATRSHSCSASSMAWVVSTTVTPSVRSSRTRRHVVARAWGSIPAVGSSRNTTAGRPTRQSASDRRWRCPPESRRTIVPLASRRPTRSSSRSGSSASS